jgi:hypothetical protein
MAPPAPDEPVHDVADEPVDVVALAAELRAEADARRARGEYPPGLEEELSGHLERITHQAGRPLAVHQLRAGLARVAEAGRLRWPAAEVASRVPGGAAVHSAVARLVGRQVGGLVEQLRTYVGALDQELSALVDAVEEPATHLHADLAERLDALEDRLAAIERALSLRVGGRDGGGSA